MHLLIFKFQLLPDHCTPALNILLEMIYAGKAVFRDASILPDVYELARDLKLNLPIVPERIEVSVVELER